MKIKTIMAALAFMAMPAFAFAQSDKTNEQISKELGHQISILNAEIKTLKAKRKADPTNAEYVTEQAKKEGELKQAREQKKILDTAIKAEKTSKKETQQAEKALKKHESASQDAEALKSGDASMKGKSNELVSDELKSKIDITNNEIKTLKAKKKAAPNDITIDAEISKKEVELKDAKRRKKVIDEAIKAAKASKKETKQAEKAQKKHADAHKSAEEMKSKM